MDAITSTHSDHPRIRRRHKKRVRQPVRISARLLVAAILIALLGGLFCIWQMQKPARSPESLESLQP